MKRILLLLSLLFASPAFADEITWLGYSTSTKQVQAQTRSNSWIPVQVVPKQYVWGVTYPNGTMTISSGNAGWAVQRAVFLPYQTSDGAWRMQFSLSATFTSTSTSAVTWTVTGITYKSSTNFYQAGSGIWFGSAQGAQSYATSGGNTWTVTSSSAATVTGLACAGDVELDSKPTWAD